MSRPDHYAKHPDGYGYATSQEIKTRILDIMAVYPRLSPGGPRGWGIWSRGNLGGRACCPDGLRHSAGPPPVTAVFREAPALR